MVPRPLWRAAKSEARLQGRPLTQVMSTLLEAWLRTGPAWRAYLKTASERPAADERGSLRPRGPTTPSRGTKPPK